jgi:hypothetical protein
MKTILQVLLIFFFLIIFISCKEDAVGPDDSNAVPGRRDYTWVADTIKNPFLLFYNIWGDASNNVWSSGSLMSEALYRYDGTKWDLDNRVYISDPDAIWGYENNIWVGNDKGCIWKFTNELYKQELKDFKVDENFMDFIEMSGTSNNEIYTVGYNRSNPIIMKYNGSTWNVEKKLQDQGIFNQIKYCSRNNKYYLVCALSDYSTRIYEYDRSDLKMIYEYSPSNAGPTIATIDGYAYIVIEHKIYRYFNDNLEFIFEVNDSNFGGTIWGRNRNDIFIRMQDGLAHYNGTDWQYLFKSSEAVSLVPNSAIFEKDFFVPAKIRRTGYPIIYHGTLK